MLAMNFVKLIKSLNDENNVKMSTSSLRGGKAFAAELKIRELKTRISKLNAQKLKISPNKIMQNSVLNMNFMKSVKYGLSPGEIERQSLTSEQFRILSNMQELKKLINFTLDLLDMIKKRYSAKRKKLRKELLIGEKELVLAKRIKKKAASGKFYKKSVQTIFYFNKYKTFTIRRIQLIDSIKHYWLKDAQNNRKLPKRFQRTELFAIRGNFVM